jgi:hypothetical protein
MTSERRLRIAVTGASGVGKSSLSELIAIAMDLPLIPEIARELCLQRGHANPAEIPDQQTFRQEVLEKQTTAESECPNYVSDRSTIDCWVMWQRWHICTAMTYETEAYYEQCRTQANNYTHVIYIPPMFPAVEDAFRWTEPDYIKQLDRLTRLTLYDWSMNDRTYTITRDTPRDRLMEVTEWING